MPEPPRILLLGDTGPDWRYGCQSAGETVRADTLSAALDLLRQRSFDAVLANPADPLVRDALRNLLRSERILAKLPDGVALVDFDLKIRWANPAFESWCGGSVVGRGFYESLGAAGVAEAEFCPFHTALAGGFDNAAPGLRAATNLHCRGNRHIELSVIALHEPNERDPLFLAFGHDITGSVQQRQKLDALHKAGRELAALSPDQLAEMSVPERIELLKQNIRRFTRDIFHYETIEVRLLDRRTGRLEPLLQDGMGPEAIGRKLCVETEGQGVTGYVAATGKSYLCPDTHAEPMYLSGAPGARSSLTVPLLFNDEVVGTFNVESPAPNAFTEADLQFLELFSHEIAAALHTLELLSAEKRSAASQSIEAISREVALPVDEILASATGMLERYIGHDLEMAAQLRQILAGARSIKACIQLVGEVLAPDAPPSSAVKQVVPPSLKGKRILVADNDDRVRRSAHGLLGRWGCIVETARDAREAVTMARLGTYDAILADIRLPDMDGYEAYKKLHEAQPSARVVLMTGYGYDPNHTLVKARQDGLKHVLFKPFRVDQLMQSLTAPDVASGRAAQR